MKIAIFGDSNVWGFDPRTGLRQSSRFVTDLARLEPQWQIVEDGLNGRLLDSQEPYFYELAGSRQIGRFTLAAAPYDALVIVLGSNDARRMFNRSLQSWTQSFVRFVSVCKQANEKACQAAGCKVAPILFVEPPAIPAALRNNYEAIGSYGDEGMAILAGCGKVIHQIADQEHCYVLDTQQAGLTGGIVDGIHLDKTGHEKLAHLLADRIEQMIAQGIIV